MTTYKTTEGSTQQPGKPEICELTEFKTNSKIFTSPPALWEGGVVFFPPPLKNKFRYMVGEEGESRIFPVE